MASRRILSPPKRNEQATKNSPINLEAHFQRSEEQRALAQEMIHRVQEMCRRAAEMRRRPRLTFP